MNKYLIVGLGNPGFGYRKNRHNAGYIVLDEIASILDMKISKQLYKSKMAKFKDINGEHILIKPLQYMNNSGINVNTYLYKENIPVENLVVIYDDIDIPFGAIRYRDKGSAGTHNGMRSIISQIGRDDFKRIRIGIGKPEKGMDLAKYVLSNFSKEQLKIIKTEITKEIKEKLFSDFLYGAGD